MNGHKFRTLRVNVLYTVHVHLVTSKDKDLFIGLQEFVVGYSKAPEQPQSSARPICHFHAMTRTGREPATIRMAAQELAALRTAPWETTPIGPVKQVYH